MFTLDSCLEKSSFKILDLPLSEVRLKNNHYFLWLVLVPRVSSVITEICDLSSIEQKILMDEIINVSRAIRTLISPDKINIGALGNLISQLHIHVIARFKNDLCWPHSVWQENAPEKSYSIDEKNQLINQLVALLS